MMNTFGSNYVPSDMSKLLHVNYCNGLSGLFGRPQHHCSLEAVDPEVPNASKAFSGAG
jgi:hypothetical protein